MLERYGIVTRETMLAVTVRELRQNLSVYLRRIEAGETLTVTRRGQRVAVLAPPPDRRSAIDWLIVERGSTRPAGDLLDLRHPRPNRGRSRSARLSKSSARSAWDSLDRLPRLVRSSSSCSRSPVERKCSRGYPLMPVDDGVLDGAAEVEPEALRSLDAIHLASGAVAQRPARDARDL